MKVLIGKKLGMTQVFTSEGMVRGATALEVGPCVVTMVKEQSSDQVHAVQLGWAGGAKRLLKPQRGHTRELGSFRVLKQFRLKQEGDGTHFQRGQVLTCEQFNVGERVTVTARSKGKGFQGVVKRHHFHGSPKSHGHKDQLRMPGSSGAGGVQHVRKGKRMSGRMGAAQVTVKNLTVVARDPEHHQLLLGGAVPGARGTIVTIRTA